MFKSLCVTLLAMTSVGFAGDLMGTVSVMKKGGRKPLSSFDNAVVQLKGVPQTKSLPILISYQKDKSFEPRLLVVVKGQEVHFHNSDPIQHNVFSRDQGAEFDLGHYPKGEFKAVTFQQPGRFKVYCNIHQDMVQDVVVVENTFFATTDEEGRFVISGVPPGKYELEVWHIYGGYFTQPVEVTDAEMKLELSVVSTKHVREVKSHLNKEGQQYKDDDGY